MPIPQGTKGPRTPGWNKKENALRSQADLPQNFGIGLAHAYSGTMALDIDNWQATQALLNDHGINLIDFYNDPDAVIIERAPSVSRPSIIESAISFVTFCHSRITPA